VTTAILIPIEGPIVEVELDETLEQLQELVGGVVQALPLPVAFDVQEQATAYVHDEGRLIGLPVNWRATDFLVPGIGLFWGDYVAGPMLLCGFDPRTGRHAALPEPLRRRVELIASESA
jgi:hypothetical protein